MHNSRLGHRHPAEIGDWGAEPGTLAEADDREVRKPRTLLRLVDAQPAKPLVHVLGEPRRAALVVVADEHPDGARLAVADRREHGPLGSPGCRAQSRGNGLELA